MVAPLAAFGTLLTGRALHQEGKAFMKNPIVYVAGAAAALIAAWVLFGEGEVAAATPAPKPAPQPCGGVGDLREPLRSEIMTALADPHVTADKLETLARAIDAITPPYACPAAAEEVRREAKARAVVVPLPPPPVTPPSPPVHNPNCSPTGVQTYRVNKLSTIRDVCRAVTGKLPSATEPLDTQLLQANAAGGTGWTFGYRIDVMTPPDYKTVSSSSKRQYDHYVHPSDVPAPPGSLVTWEFASIAPGTVVHLPVEWNKYLHWDGTGYSPVGDGTTFPPC